MDKKLLLLLLCLLTFNLLFAQEQGNITVSGKVTDASTGQPLIGASVQVKGTTQGAQTDVEGNFTVNAPANGTLIVNYLGYDQREIAINNNSTLNVQLGMATNELEQVVVVGYGVQEKRDVTGSIASVEGEEIARQSSQNPVSSLQGKVAGVTITNNGQPGASPQIRIRGTGSALGGSDPLYVVDGTFVQDLSFLNPNDIESIEVLKDASSAAIYGIRAANGVVLVTTKRGKAGQTRINYNGFVGVQQATNKLEMANAQEYAALINEKEGTNLVGTDYPTTDWYDQILQTATIHNHQISASGGSEKATYYLSAGYLNQEGIVKGNDYERITARLQTDIKLSDNVKIGYNTIFYNYNSNDIPGDIFYQAYVAPPVVPVREANGWYGDPNNPGTYNLGSFGNPQAALDWFNRESQGQRLTGNAFGEVNFLKDFTFRTSLGINYGIEEYRSYTSQDSLTSTQFAERSLLEKSRDKTTSWLWENTLTYSKTFGDHDITALVGTSAQQDRRERMRGFANDVDYNTEANLYLSLGDPGSFRIINGGADDDSTALERFNSYFGRVNYSYKDRYLLTAMLRYDGSSKFPKDNRWDYFPSIGLGWRVTEEPFMQDQTVINNLKLKASWGKLGNNNIPANIYNLQVSRPGRYIYTFGGVPYLGASIATSVPTQLLWEVVKETDLGAEFGLLNNRLTVEADWYNKETENAIYGIVGIGSLGLSGEIRGNYASFRNRGFELAANWQDDASDDFSYNVGFNFSVNKNEVTDLQTGNVSLYSGNLPVGGYQVSVTRIGDPIGSFYGYEVDGIFQNEQEIAESLQPTAEPGYFRYRDLNDDGVIDQRDRTIIGNPNPGFTYAINTGFRYKSFDLQLDIQGVADVDIYNANRNVRVGNENFDQDFFQNRWHGAGTSNTYPSAALIGPNLDPNSFYVEKGDYIRIRNVQVGYNLPTDLVNKWKMQNLRIYVNAQNPVTFFNYNGFSPEVGGAPISQGIDRNVYPLSATYNFGVNVTF
ncbi:SusC/RagA family TonB-linked outer membrane protein [Pontibacter silvestris]|uniref:SusC/RagA family TonB-linked outer membrane protein n=1 Tax=Pontibacter silvestris TaxID=2305183 RepID=A0ABW4X386_9BACT|nr:TonB-dependent receptor [Pontibacter silvestris]MCC9137888.1 TonB-dependent receptor [Pontibacter silvestris]